MDRELPWVSTLSALDSDENVTGSGTESALAVPQLGGSPTPNRAAIKRGRSHRHVQSIAFSDSEGDAPLAATKPKRRRLNSTLGDTMIEIAGSRARSDQQRNSLLEKQMECGRQKDGGRTELQKEREEREFQLSKMRLETERNKSKAECERAKADQEKAKVETLKLQLLLAQVQRGQNFNWAVISVLYFDK